jgi:filamentous hemagglutinin
MNRQRYQLVFNRHRGMLMAVAETASAISGQKLPTARRGAGVVAPASWKFCTLVLALALTWQSLAHAQILVDRNAPREEQPMVLKAANGVPVVNIRQPNTKGLSVNSYRRFDVDGRGVILNNAGGASKSELGGYIAGNPWMPGGGAQVIVNQVNATDPSYLRGFIEVAGNPAQVIIANPAGITCAGCGFINAQRATMTTGTPVIRQGSLESYRVNSGVISFEGLGLQAGGTAYADVIARAVRVNAELRAKQIRLTTGLNTVSADLAQVTPGQSATDGAPVRAIDVAALGGMYAGHIYLSATEHGVGVHNGGTLTATEGQLVVTAAGRLENTGTLAARGDTVIAAAGPVSNGGTGTMGSESTLRIHATALDNAGTLDASRQLQIRTTGALINQGSLGARDSTLLEVGTLENTGTGRIGSTGDTRVQSSASIRNAGSLLGDAGITLAAVTLENTGSVLTPATLALRIRNTLDNSGKVGSNARLEVQATTLTNRGDIYSAQESVQLQVAGRLFNSGSIEAKRTLDANAVAIENQGRVIGEAALNASASAALTNTGTMGSKGNADFKAASLDNRGTLSAVQSLSLKVTGKFTNEKNVGAGSTLQVDADALDNSGKLFSQGSLLMGKMGGSASYSSSRTNSNYASVMEQSGVKAGDGGFQINVRGNTDLKGAVIASSGQAVADNKNRLTTQTLTQSDIKNTAEYDAQSVGVGIGYSTGKSNPVGRDQQGNAQTGGARVPGADLPTTGKDGGFSATPPVVMGAGGSSSSVTRSGISGGNITITDEKKQQELTGKSAEQTVASVNRDVSTAKDGSNALKPIFDEAQIQNSYAIVSALSREMGSFVTNRAREADDKIKAAKDPNSSLTMDQRQALLSEAAEMQRNWGPEGGYRQITTALVAGIGGNVTGSVGEFVQAATVNYLQSLSANKVKTIADEIKSEPARAALHAIVACAGASAQGANCAAGAMGASASSLLGWALGSTEGMTAEERQARLNVVTNLVSGLASTGAQAAAAGNAAIIEAENNQVALPPSALPPIILPGNQKIPSGKPPGYVPTIEEQIESEDRGKPIYNGSPSGPLINVGADTLPTVDDFVRGMAALCKASPICNGLNIIMQQAAGDGSGKISQTAPAADSKSVREIVRGNTVKYGDSNQAFNVKSESDLIDLYNKITAGAKDATPSGYDGVSKILEDGTRIGLRNGSKTGGMTIDVNPAAGSGKPYKVHIEKGS